MDEKLQQLRTAITALANFDIELLNRTDELGEQYSFTEERRQLEFVKAVLSNVELQNLEWMPNVRNIVDTPGQFLDVVQSISRTTSTTRTSNVLDFKIQCRST